MSWNLGKSSELSIEISQWNPQKQEYNNNNNNDDNTIMGIRIPMKK